MPVSDRYWFDMSSRRSIPYRRISEGSRKHAGLSDDVIGLTIVAFGTSLPELVTVITSLKKKNSDIGIGNIIGANIFNVSLVLGSSASLGTLVITEGNLALDFPIVIILTGILLVPLVLRGKSNKLQGLLLIGTYTVYMTLLWTFWS